MAFIRARSLAEHRHARPGERRIGETPAGGGPRWRPGLIRSRLLARRGEALEPASPPPEEAESVQGDAELGRRRRVHRQEAAPKPPPESVRRWGPQARLGPNLFVQAAEGYRAAIIELRPGLHLVAEVPEATLQGEFGAVGLLAPLLIRTAAHALTAPGTAPTPTAAPGAASASTPSPGATPAPSALTKLVNHAVDAAVAPRPDYWEDDRGFEGTRCLPPPAVAGPPLLPAPARWADAETVAGVLGWELRPAGGGR